MDLLSSDEEECQVEFWNNWSPNAARKPDDDWYKSYGKRIRQSREVLSDFSRAAAVISSVDESRFGNWIPPVNFLYSSKAKDVQDPVPKKNQRRSIKEKESTKAVEKCEVTKKIEGTSENITRTTISTTALRKESNSDWGERIELHDVTKFNDGDLFWGVVDLGVFGNIQLRVNEYGHICCSASGKISKIGSREITYISISGTELLRKMLTISSDQWASLCETVKETKTVLKFCAFEDCDLQKRSPLEKLWFLICKRRHFLPRQCMLLKFCGAVKCMRKLEITPKLVVQDIRYI